MGLQEIKKLVEHTSAADVLVKVCRRQFPRGKDSLMNSMSVVTPNRSEMKHYRGEQHHNGGGDHSRSVYFINLLAGPVISVLVGRSSLARPCKTGREIYKARGENEGNKMKKRFKYRYIVKEELL